MKSEGATEVTPSIETVARCDGASSLALAGYLSFGLSANLALSEQYARVAVEGKQGVRGYPQAGYLRLIDPVHVTARAVRARELSIKQHPAKSLGHWCVYPRATKPFVRAPFAIAK